MNGQLTQDMIQQPRQWRLALEVCGRSLGCALWPEGADDSAIAAEIGFPADANGQLRGLEEAVYANPLLLEDFAAVTVAVDSREFTIVPSPLAESCTPAAILEAAGLESEGREVVVDFSPAGFAIVYTVDSALFAFLRRTFFNVEIIHRLTPLINARLAAVTDAAPGSQAVAGIAGDGRIDIIATTGSALAAANTFAYTDTADAAYCLLAVDTVATGGAASLAVGGSDAGAVAAFIGRYAAAPDILPPSPLAPRFGDTAPALTAALAAYLETRTSSNGDNQ